jgi:peptide/nickel transport system permease protein
MNLPLLILRRVVLTIPVVVGVTVITFGVSHSVPGDPARAFAGTYADQATIAAIRHKWGLDQPIVQQYWTYVQRLARGDLGTSIQTRHPVLSDIGTRLPATLELAIFALLLMCVIGIGLGVAAATWHNRFPDHLARVTAVGGGAIPSFWLALVLQLIFFRQLGWLPAGGRLGDFTTPPDHITGFYLVDSAVTGNWPVFVEAVKHLLLPAFTLALLGIAGITRMTRSSMLEVLQKDYVRAARARGIRGRDVVLRHALRNALIPTVTIVGLLFGSMIGGAIVIEFIFSWPGIGSYAAGSITSLDYTAIMGVAVVVAVIYLITNLLVDISYMVLNPQIREG